MPGLFDRIKDTTTFSGLLTVGTSFVVDNNPAPIYQTFRNRYSINDANISVAITSQTSNNWMVCWCTYTNVDTLRVDEIIFTSNTSTPDAPVTFSGTSDVFVTASSRAVAGLREANTFTGNNYFTTGNVGIGTAVPASKLVVSAAQYNTNQDAAYLVAGTTSYTGATTNWGTYGFAHKLKSTAGGVARVALDAITAGGLTEIFCADTNGNFGIGTPSPNRKLTVSAGGSDARISILDSDTAAASAISLVEFFGNDARGGWAGISSGTLFIHGESALTGGISLRTNAVDRVRITNTGNVGIGTTSPSSPLVVSTGTANFDAYLGVNGTISIGNAQASGIVSPGIIGVSVERAGLRLVGRTADANTDGDIVFDVRPTTGGDFATVTTKAYRFTRYGSELMTILRNGNVGIGTASPGERLSVATGASEFAIEWAGPGKAWVLGSAAGRAYIRNKTDNVEAISILNSGNVGIGTTSPSGNLTVFSSTGNDSSHIRVETSVRPSLSLIQTGVQAWSFWVDSGDSSKLKIGVANGGVSTGTPYITATTVGNVGIGTANPSTQLHVVSAANFQPQIISEHVAGAGTGAAYFMLDRARGTVSAKTAVVSGDTLGTLMGRGYDGSAIQNSAWIEYTVDGTVSAGNVPGSITLLTTPVGGSAAPRMRIAANGYVSIGTSNPSALLTIDDNAAAGTGLVLTGGGSGGNLASFIRDVGAAGAVKINASSGDPQVAFESAFNTFTIGTDGNDFKISDDPVLGNNDRLTINSSGNVGIGTLSSGPRLDVLSTAQNIILSRSSGSYAAFQRSAPTGQAVYDFYTINGVEQARITCVESNLLAFATGSSANERLRIDGSGNVGINVPFTGSNAKLAVSSTGSELGGTAKSATLTTNAGALGGTATNQLSLASIGFTSSNQSMLGVWAYRHTTGTDWTTSSIVLGMDVDNTVRAGAFISLKNDGFVGIRTVNPQAALHVERDANSEGGIFINNPNTGPSSYAAVRLGPSNRGTNGDALIYTGAGSMGIRAGNRVLLFEIGSASTERMRLTTRGQPLLSNDQGPDSTDTFALGFRGAPANFVSDANYTFVLTDAGKSVIRSASAAARTWTVPASGSVNFPEGTCIIVDNSVATTAGHTITLANTNVTWRSGTGGTLAASPVVAIRGIAVIRKISGSTWVVSGAVT